MGGAASNIFLKKTVRRVFYGRKKTELGLRLSVGRRQKLNPLEIYPFEKNGIHIRHPAFYCLFME